MNKAAAKERANEAIQTYGLPIDLDPLDALLEELHRTAGHVAWLGVVVGDLEQEALHGPVGTEGIGHDDEGNMLMHHPREERTIWLHLYQDERGHLTKVAKACLDAGVDERRVRLAEQQGQIIATVIQGVLDGLGLTDKQLKQAPKLVDRKRTRLKSSHLVKSDDVLCLKY